MLPTSATLALVTIILTIATGCMVDAAYCIQKVNRTGPVNSIPLSTAPPRFVRRVPNAELYSVGEGDDAFWLVHLYSSGNASATQGGFEFGVAYGTILKDEITETLTHFWNSIRDQIAQTINGTISPDGFHFKKKFLDDVASLGLEIALDIQSAFNEPFMFPPHVEELKGIAAATGLSFTMLRDIHMMGELTKGSCSYVGANGAATLNGQTVQLRALDWNTGGGLQNQPVVAVYHPGSPSLGQPFAALGFAGFIGTLTGIAPSTVPGTSYGISEIGISYPDFPDNASIPPFGKDLTAGIPFIFLERLIVQFPPNKTTAVQHAMRMMTDANRTCRLVLGVADGAEKNSVLAQYSGSSVNFYTPENLQPWTSWHPRIQDTVFLAMDWHCVAFNQHMSEKLQQLRGKLTAEIGAKEVTSYVLSGSLHVAWMSHSDQVWYVANARKDSVTSGELDAYTRQFTRIDMKPLFFKQYGVK